MITVDIPASFKWNDANSKWVKNYLLPRNDLLLTLTEGNDIDLNIPDEIQFKALCHLLETTAEGRELRNKMFKAWRSKKSRDSDNGKKLYTFNLSIKAGDHLKKRANGKPLNKTLESLIFSDLTPVTSSASNTEQLKEKIQILTQENVKLKQTTADLAISDDAEIERLINRDMQVIELAKLEKSQLIKQILKLKRKLNK